MNEGYLLGPEFWAGVIGAVVGAIASGVISWFLQHSQFANQEKEQRSHDKNRQTTLAHSVLLKLLRIHSNIVHLNSHLEETSQAAVKEKMVIAQAYRAFANLPQRVHFTSEEMTNILSWGDLAAFNKILGVDEIHNSVLGQFETAQKYSENIKSKMKVITGQGNRVTVELDSNTRLLAMELDDLLTQMSGQLEKDRAETKQSLEELRQLTSKHLGLVVNLEFDSVPSPKA